MNSGVISGKKWSDIYRNEEIQYKAEDMYESLKYFMEQLKQLFSRI